MSFSSDDVPKHPQRPNFIVDSLDTPRASFKRQIITDGVSDCGPIEQAIRDREVVNKHLGITKNETIGPETASTKIDQFPSAATVMNSLDSELNELTTCFENAEQARLYHELIIPENEAPDQTIPTTPNQKRALVHVLAAAFKSTIHATDNEREISLFQNAKHDIRLVEIVCWRLLDACIERSYRGPLCKGFNKDRTKSQQITMTFEERFNNTVKVMILYKGCCRSMFKPTFVNEFIDNPLFHLGRATTNKRGNALRQEHIKLGKKVGGSFEEQDDSEGEDVGVAQDSQTSEERQGSDVHDGAEKQGATANVQAKVEAGDDDSEYQPSPPKRRRTSFKPKAETPKKQTPKQSARKPRTPRQRASSSVNSGAVENLHISSSFNSTIEDGQHIMTPEHLEAQSQLSFATPMTGFSTVVDGLNFTTGFGYSTSMPTFPTYRFVDDYTPAVYPPLLDLPGVGVGLEESFGPFATLEEWYSDMNQRNQEDTNDKDQDNDDNEA